MKLINTLFLILSFACFTSIGQEVKFDWNYSPSFGYNYSVKIKKEDKKHTIQINKPNSKKIQSSNITREDFDSLILFLSNYTFTTKGTSICLEMGKEYQDVKLLSDPDWIILKGDSIKLLMAQAEGLKYDNDSNKYYYEVKKMVTFTDGTTYHGKLEKEDEIKEYSTHSGRISEADYQLNLLIGCFIRKYFSKQDYSLLLKGIEASKPVRKEYQ